MLRSEFIALTGYEPTAEQYAEIERNYMAFDGDKQAFCKAWVTVNASTVKEYKATREVIGKMENKALELGIALNNVEKRLEELKKERQKLIYISRSLSAKLRDEYDKLPCRGIC